MYFNLIIKLHNKLSIQMYKENHKEIHHYFLEH